MASNDNESEELNKSLNDLKSFTLQSNPGFNFNGDGLAIQQTDGRPIFEFKAAP